MQFCNFNEALVVIQAQFQRSAFHEMKIAFVRALSLTDLQIDSKKYACAIMSFFFLLDG